MSVYDYSLVDCFLIEPLLGNRRMLRDLLVALGLRRTYDFATVGDAARAMDSTVPDLILIDAETPDSETLSAIQAIRNNRFGRNPFAAIVVTTWQPTSGVVAKATLCGADAVLVKPLSPKRVTDCLRTLIDSRKPFVVTADYLGPDRRKAPRPGTQVPLLEVPNTLRSKAVLGRSAIEVRDEIERWNWIIAEHRRVRQSVQVAFLIEFALPGLALPTPDQMSLDHLHRVPRVVEDLLVGLPDGEGRKEIEKTGKEIQDEVVRVRGLMDRGMSGPDLARELLKLQKLGYDFVRLLNPARQPSELVREVADAVSNYRTRLTQLAMIKAGYEEEVELPIGG